jgi:hypothetical protein
MAMPAFLVDDVWPRATLHRPVGVERDTGVKLDRRAIRRIEQYESATRVRNPERARV